MTPSGDSTETDPPDDDVTEFETDTTGPSGDYQFDHQGSLFADNYTIIQELGRGGMGVVFEAEQADPNRKVALKMLLAGAFAGATEVERFKTEAAAIARLDHPNIIKLLAFGEEGGQLYYTMPLVTGSSLAEREAEYTSDLKAAVRLTIEISNAVSFANSRGVLHRDLKPTNIMIDSEDRAIVTDFGLARIEGEDREITEDGAILGAPSSMSPEQADGRIDDISIATDVYGLGVILYHLLTGEPPFNGKNRLEILQQVRETPPKNPRLINREVDSDLATICLKCLEKDPTDRYASAAELADDLRRWLEKRPILARRSSFITHVTKWAMRNPAVAALSACLVLGLLFGAPTMTALWLQARDLTTKTTRLLVSANLDRVERFVEQGDKTPALMILSDTLKVDPNSAVTQERLASGLMNWLGPRPIGDSINTSNSWVQLRFLDEGRRYVAVPRRGRPTIRDTRTGEVIAQLPRHRDEILDASISPDGKYVVTASADRFAIVSNIDDAKMEYPPLRHKKNVTHAAFSPDQRFVVTVCSDKILRVWDMPSGKQLAAFTAGLEQNQSDPPLIRALAFNNNGTMLAFGDAGGGVTVLRMDELQRPEIYMVFEKSIDALTFDPTGLLAVGLSDGKIALGSPESLSDTKTLRARRRNITSLSFNSTGTLLASASLDGRVDVYDSVTREPVAELSHQGGENHSVQFSPNDDLLVSTDSSGVAIWRVEGKTNAPVFHRSSSIQNDANGDSTFSSDGPLLTGGLEGTLALWDPGYPKNLVHHRDRVRDMAMTKTSPPLVISGSFDGTARIWDCEKRRLIVSLDHESEVFAVDISRNGDFAATGEWNGKAWIWDLRTIPPQPTELSPSSGGAVRTIRLSSEGQYVVTASSDKTARVYSISTGQQVGSPISHKSWVISVDFSPDNKTVATASRAYKSFLTPVGSTNTPQVLAEGSRLESVDFSPDGRWVATGGIDQMAQVWDAHTSKPFGPPLKHKGKINTVEFSPDSNRLLTASADGTAQVWDFRSGRRIGRPLRHRRAIQAARFSADGSRVATASDDYTARIWDADSGLPLSDPFQHGEAVSRAVFGPQGKHLVTTSYDGTVRFWKVPGRNPLPLSADLARLARELKRLLPADANP